LDAYSLSNSDMRTIDDIRHARLMELLDEAGSVQRLADKLEKSHSQVSQWKRRAVYGPNGERRSISTAMAREIEQKCGKPSGWMDTDPSGQTNPLRSERSAQSELPLSPLSPSARQVVWRAAANRLAEVAAKHRWQMDHETFLLFVDAAVDELDSEISEAAAERVFKRWLPVLSRGRAIGHAHS
jgi:hypothetical protein